MHALIVVSHPEPGSLTHRVAAEIAKSIADAGAAHTFEVADLAAEGFDPRYNPADLALFRNQGQPPPTCWQSRHGSNAPMRWCWSFRCIAVLPATLKGWIDRVFTGGWAYSETSGGLLKRLPVHLVAIGASGKPTYDKHGYATAMKTQIEHGIFGYCGARVVSSHLLTEADEGFPQTHFDTARRVGRELPEQTDQQAP